MGYNEGLMLVSGALCAMLIFAAWKVSKERLYIAIVIFLILIATVGSKLVDVFGYQTNTGNIFYASVFLATYCLIERYGKNEGMRSIWVAITCVMFFAAIVSLTAALISDPATEDISKAISQVFSYTPRFALASLLAYAVSQTINVHLYIYLKEHFSLYSGWARANFSNAVAQVFDSLVFFCHCFLGRRLPSKSL